MEVPAEPVPAPGVTGVSIALKLDSTVTLYDSAGNATDWLKPGVEASMKWNGIPTEEQINASVALLRDKVISPVLDDVIQTVTDRTIQMRQGRY